MAQSSKEIKGRIRTVKNTRQITKAMELVSASKMRRAQQRVLASRAYATRAWDLLVRLSEVDHEARGAHPLLVVRPVKKIAIVFFTSNRGLAGGYNSHIIKKVLEQVKDPASLALNRLNGERIAPEKGGVEIDFITVGKKGEQQVRKMGKNIVAAFAELSDTPTAEETLPLVRLAIEEYQKGHYDKVVLAYTDFVSTINQIPKLRQLLPVSRHDLEKMMTEADRAHALSEEQTQPIDYLFEPTPAIVLDRVLRSLVETQLYQALLESRASEHAARMLAMKNASDSAADMLDDLTLSFNQARQAGITREIAEIAAGSAAIG